MPSVGRTRSLLRPYNHHRKHFHYHPHSSHKEVGLESTGGLPGVAEPVGREAVAALGQAHVGGQHVSRCHSALYRVGSRKQWLLCEQAGLGLPLHSQRIPRALQKRDHKPAMPGREWTCLGDGKSAANPAMAGRPERNLNRKNVLT